MKFNKYLLKSRYLNEPADIVRVDVMYDCPMSKFVPFISRPAIDWQPVLGILVLVFFEIRHNFLDNTHSTYCTTRRLDIHSKQLFSCRRLAKTWNRGRMIQFCSTPVLFKTNASRTLSNVKKTEKLKFAISFLQLQLRYDDRIRKKSQIEMHSTWFYFKFQQISSEISSYYFSFEI